MPEDTVIYHNPRCTKSRQTLELLQRQGIEPQVVEYLKTPPSARELKAILKKLNIPARKLLRSGETEYIELGLSDDAIPEDRLIEAMVLHPKLIERPIVIRGKKAALGRPPENVLPILHD